MADKVSSFELNAQLQVLDARLKKTEQNISVLAKSLSEVSLAANAKTGAAFGGNAAKLATMASLDGNAFADQFSSLADGVDGTDLQKYMEGLTLQKAVKGLGTTTMPDDILSAATQRLDEEKTAVTNKLNAELAKPIEQQNSTLIAQYKNTLKDVTDGNDSLVSAQKATSNTAKSISKNSIITS